MAGRLAETCRNVLRSYDCAS